MTEDDARPRGRQAEARRNDGAVLAAALAVFAADPAAPMSAVAHRAEVGQASLYRRYPSRDALLVAVADHGLTALRDAARAAAGDDDPGRGVADFLDWLVTTEALRLSALLGSFRPPEHLVTLAHEGNRAIADLVGRAVDAGALRPEITGADLTLVATPIGHLRTPDAERTRVLRQRYLALALAGLTRPDGPPLPGPAPDAAELERPWRATAE